MSLPQEFIDYTSALFGKERWEKYLSSFNESVPVSVRMNPWKQVANQIFEDKEPVDWCRNGYYLPERPNFTMDPLFHAGAYYVQEASSMFLDEILRQLSENGLLSSSDKSNLTALDLCAAPGGKSTLLRAALNDNWQLYSNEPDHRRANILMENLQKQGHPKVIVTNNYPIDYQRAGLLFDFILCDVPCSGEGMFRKDEETINEWSLQNVMKCASLQRSIVENIWPCLNDGGIMVYSTCTFNTRENEENVRWICETLGAEMIPVTTSSEWNVTSSLLPDWNAPVYRFIPGITKGEGLFMAVLRKVAGTAQTVKQKKGTVLRVLSDGEPQPTIKGKNIIPAHEEALLTSLTKDKYPRAELSLDDALRYLHHEAIILSPDIPKGIAIVTYKGIPLGFVKNIGNRANNLYPKEWKIRSNII